MELTMRNALMYSNVTFQDKTGLNLDINHSLGRSMKEFKVCLQVRYHYTPSIEYHRILRTEGHCPSSWDQYISR